MLNIDEFNKHSFEKKHGSQIINLQNNRHLIDTENSQDQLQYSEEIDIDHFDIQISKSVQKECLQINEQSESNHQEVLQQNRIYQENKELKSIKSSPFDSEIRRNDDRFDEIIKLKH